jgi:transmembrane sensor
MSDSYQRFRDSLEPGYSEQEIRENWQRIEDRQGPVKVRRNMLSLAALGTCAVAAAVLFFGSSNPSSKNSSIANLTAVDQSISMEAGATFVANKATNIALSDGSALSLAPNAKLNVIGNEGSRFVTQLQRGNVHFNVKPRGPRTWEIETGIATVEVVGTEFDVNVEDDGLLVTVSRGVVLVRGERVPGRVVRLTAGMSIRVKRERTEAIPAAASVEPKVGSTAVALAEVGDRMSSVDKALLPSLVAPAKPAQQAPAPQSPMVTPPAVISPSVASVTMAHAPETRAAAESFQPSPSPTLQTVQTLLRDVDALRATNPAAAIALLSSQIDRYSNDPSYGVAAFTLGRMTLDAKDYTASATAFEIVIRNGKPVSLVQDAQARRVEAMLRGKLPGAAASLQTFVLHYPMHPRRARLEILAAGVDD